MEKIGEKAKSLSNLDQGAVAGLTESVLGTGSNVFEASVKTTPQVENNVTIDLVSLAKSLIKLFNFLIIFLNLRMKM